VEQRIIAHTARTPITYLVSGGLVSIYTAYSPFFYKLKAFQMKQIAHVIVFVDGYLEDQDANKCS
jgi:hypothetical protein